jgi:arginine decarboxylase
VFPLKASHDRPTLLHLLGKAAAPTWEEEGGAAAISGLEVGSKAELVAAAALLSRESGNPEPEAGGGLELPLLVCNGAKDADYLDLAARVAESGLAKVFVVLESLEEVALGADRLRPKPGGALHLGLRARLDTFHAGHFGATSGPRSQFGLGPAELWRSLQVLRQRGSGELFGSLRMLHFHIGSNVPDIRVVKKALREAACLYAECCSAGAPMGWLDVGGGLGVDFGGGGMNYDVDNYANDVVAAVQDICRRRGLPPPALITESGTAVVAHSSVLVAPAHAHRCATGAVEREETTPTGVSGADSVARSSGEADFLLGTFEEVLRDVSPGRLRESLTDALQLRSEASSLFALGAMALEQRAATDILFQRVLERVRELGASVSCGEATSPGVAEILGAEAPFMTLELSVFQSVIDAWGLGQRFPVVPLQRLQDEPDVWARLADVTCDSDGRLCSSVGWSAGRTEDYPRGARVHSVAPGEDYQLGIFMVGAYQRAMGSAHNLFGRPLSASVAVDEAGCPTILEVRGGASVGEALAAVSSAYSEDLDAITRWEPALGAALGAIRASSTYPKLGGAGLPSEEAGGGG